MQVALQGDTWPWDPLGMLPAPHSLTPAKHCRVCLKGRDVPKETSHQHGEYWLWSGTRLRQPKGQGP